MEIYNRKIVELLCSRNEEFLKLFKNSKGLCIPHFALLLKMIKDTMGGQSQEIIKTIIDVEEKNFSQLKSELSEYIRRQSYEFSDKDRKAVEDVLLKSVQKIVGRRGIKHDNI
jgi:predicted solute-binding protein